MVGLTGSDGRVALGIIEDAEGGGEARSMGVARHEVEAWTLAFMPDASALMSGGDDSALRFVDLGGGEEEGGGLDTGRYTAARYVAWTDKKVHGAGVTAILPLQMGDEGAWVVTGSYDDRIRLVWVAVGGRRDVLAEMELGGGVWRVKMLERKPMLPANHGVGKWRSEPPPEEVLLLVSCMHAGARVVRLSRGDAREWKFEVLARFEEHESMNYGSDCQPRLNSKGERTFITTSFYDRLLCLWRF